MEEQKTGESKSKSKKCFPKLFFGLKCINSCLLVVAFAVHLHNLFTATWATDIASDKTNGHHGKIHHQLFGFTEEGDRQIYPLHREGNWQAWKRPLIRLEIISLSLGFTAAFVHGIIIFLHFLHPRKGETMALLSSVALLACGGGTLLVIASMQYTNNRPVYGFKQTSIPTNMVTDITEENGGMEAKLAGVLYFVAGVVDVILVLITCASKSPKSDDVIKRLKDSDDIKKPKTPELVISVEKDGP
ncbi:uncharacterized protein [Argopecten irradians]|uniref:uncharacterized protein n=1 Tax=Argopecten irradians TaxID=31199 RepID=UPI0037241464